MRERGRKRKETQHETRIFDDSVSSRVKKGKKDLNFTKSKEKRKDGREDFYTVKTAVKEKEETRDSERARVCMGTPELSCDDFCLEKPPPKTSLCRADNHDNGPYYGTHRNRASK